jgi:hypothetical protein
MCVTKRTSKENWLMTVVAQILDGMNGITKPQRKFLLTLFVSMLVTRGRLNFLNLSRHSSLDEKTYRRHFQKAFSFVSFNQLSIAQAVPTQHTKLFAQDASFSAKSGKHTYGLDRFWNGTTAKVERGLEVSVISIVDVEANQAFALCAHQTPPSLTTPKTEKTATRIDFYLEHLTATAAHLPAGVKYGVFDGFYAKQKFVAGVCALGYHVVSKLRADAHLLYLYTGEQKKRGRRRKYDGKVSFSDLSRFEQSCGDEAHLTLYTLVVWSVSLQRRVRVVVVGNTKDKEKPRYVVLFATDTELAAADILRFYKARFQIEMVFTQMTKAMMRAVRRGGYHVADLYHSVRHDHTVDQQLDQCSSLRERGVPQPGSHLSAEGFDRLRHRAQLAALASRRVELPLLCAKAFTARVQLAALAVELG